jgi:hypothetical protein
VKNLYRFYASGDQVAKALEKGTLEALYATASPENTLTTELLARHMTDLSVRRIPKMDSFPDLLSISLSAIAGETARIISSDPKARERNERLLQQNLQRTFTIVRLPPLRATPQE